MDKFKAQDRKSLDCLEEIICGNMGVKVVWVRAQEGKSWRAVSIVLEHTHTIMNRMLLGIGMLMVLLVRSQTEFWTQT